MQKNSVKRAKDLWSQFEDLLLEEARKKDDEEEEDGSPSSGAQDTDGDRSHDSYLSGAPSIGRRSSGIVAEGGESVQDED